METPALIFDEVDVGISGPTAAVVGKLLRQLGESTQVMCVTHLPQVAGCGHHHFIVSKETDGEMTETHMKPLDKRSRLQELARLLGAVKSPVIRSRMRKNCWRHKLFRDLRVIQNNKNAARPVSKWGKVYYHRHITYEPRTARARKGIKSLCAVKR